MVRSVGRLGKVHEGDIMTDQHDPAFPEVLVPDGRGGTLDSYMGLTKREYFAALVMQALSSTDLYFGTVGEPKSPWDWVSREAVAASDALIAELNKEVKP